MGLLIFVWGVRVLYTTRVGALLVVAWALAGLGNWLFCGERPGAFQMCALLTCPFAIRALMRCKRALRTSDPELP